MINSSNLCCRNLTEQTRINLSERYRREAGYIEQLGTGIMRIKEECKKMALPEPKFEKTSNFFKATIFRTQLILAPDLEVIYDLI